MEKIIAQIENWKFLSTMPDRIGEFSLSLEPLASSTWRRVFAYQNERLRRSFSIVYDQATKEYLAKVVVGLTEFCDIDYITSDLGKLEVFLSNRLEKTLYLLDSPDKTYLESGFLQKKIIEWPYAQKLPGSMAGFELFISPDASVKVINGSYIIIDYSDFETESGLVIYYNIFRDEFFGESRLKRMPVRTAAFDAKNLSELEEKIKNGLEPVLESIRLKI